MHLPVATSGFPRVVGAPAMSLSDILVSAQVLPQHADQLINDGWTTEHFALCATSLEDFDAVMTDLFDTGLSPLHKASLRLAWKKCQSSTHQGALAPTPAVANPEVAAPPLAGSWSETFAPKLTSANVSQIKAAFKKNYPAEVLLPENLPSLRLLSMVVHQKSKQDFKWIPWKYRLTSAKCDELTSSKSSKMARAEGIQLHSILMDEPPAMEISNGGLGLHALRQMFETFAFAMSMAEVCHLSSLKAYYLKFLSLMTQKFDADTGLRGPTILEAQAADKALMITAIDLVMERSWTWDDALYEVTHITFVQISPHCCNLGRNCRSLLLLSVRIFLRERANHKGPDQDHIPKALPRENPKENPIGCNGSQRWLSRAKRNSCA